MPKRFTSISTKTGDAGESGLANGQRLSKSAPIFAVLGDLDELNSWVGLVITELPSSLHTTEGKFLLDIQKKLYVMSAELAGSPKAKLTSANLKAFEQHSEELQRAMDEKWTTQFLYPGGSHAAAIIDIARTVCRRAERTLAQYHEMHHQVSPTILAMVNRMSDYFYILRCHANAAAQIDERKFSL